MRHHGALRRQPSIRRNPALRLLAYTHHRATDAKEPCDETDP
jgi:hypothetical protein